MYMKVVMVYEIKNKNSSLFLYFKYLNIHLTYKKMSLASIFFFVFHVGWKSHPLRAPEVEFII